MVRTPRREMVLVPKSVIRLGLTDDEADRLADELVRMEEALFEPGGGGFNVFDFAAARARRREWLAAAMPAHEVEVGPFEIDVYPVANAQWWRYMHETRARGPRHRIDKGLDFLTGVSWQEAQAYAHHERLDLPTEAEWEAAARRDRSFFTWGNAYFPEGDIAFRPPVRDPYPIGSRPELVSAHGVHDLLGQFGEYCWDPFEPYPGTDPAWWAAHFPSAAGQRTVRGGYDLNQDATCVSRRGVPPDERRTHIKFRCVRRM